HFGIRAWHEHARADMKVDVPEGAAASDVSYGLALLASLHHLGEALGNLLVWRRQQQPVAVDVQRLGHQKLGIKARRIAGFAKLARRVVERADYGLHASSSPASRSASSSAASASISSPSAGPSSTSVRLCLVRLMRWSVMRP